MIEDPIRVKNCPLCRIFTHKEVVTKLYWPNTIEEVPDSEFVIVDCKSCNIPMVVLGEHVTSLNKECWGRILYRTKNIFGKNIILRTKTRTIRDHWHAHIQNINKY